MEPTGRTVWQQAAGDTDRNYSDVCLKWGVILNGPGYAGHWKNGGEQQLRSDGWSEHKLTDLRRFAEEIKEGDLVVLRLGTSKVCGVGRVVGGYEWSDAFGDIDGWDLQHVRRIDWFWKPDGAEPTFAPSTMKWGDTTQRLTSEPVLNWVKTLDVPKAAPTLAALPQDASGDYPIDGLSGFLFDKGVASGSIAVLTHQIGELVRIAKWYEKPSNGDPSEHETVSYLVVPLLRALGWTPQKMAIEWHHVDVALFSSLPRADEKLAVVVEAKKRGNSCLSALSQAQAYAEPRPSCIRVIVTDGIRFGVFSRDGTEFKLRAYMNLTRLRKSYPVYDCEGVNEAMLAMTPEANKG